MVLACVCDQCGQISESDYMTLTAWWGKYQFAKDLKIKDGGFDVKLRSDIEGLSAHICQNCQEKLASLINFSNQISIWEKRKIDYEEWIAQNNGKPELKGLLKTYPGGIKSVTCDICGDDCFEKHLNFKSNRKNPDKTYLGADICQACVIKHLTPLIKFRSVVSNSSNI